MQDSVVIKVNKELEEFRTINNIDMSLDTQTKSVERFTELAKIFNSSKSNEFMILQW